jgi:exopolyphosphatase/guanosine-5'-triphosphate,3'-diphosphate pyrophosphatase
MREAYNGKEVALIKKKADIKNRNYRWKKEAAIIASTDLHHLLKRIRRIFVDVGGSTEFTLFLMVN